MKPLPESLRTVLITDGRGDFCRLAEIVSAALGHGISAVQLREPGMTARQLADLCAALKPLFDERHGLLIVNDRADLVAAGLAHGVHLGHRSLRPAQVRGFLPPGSLIGCSAHDETELRAAAAADYVHLSPLFATRCKPGAEPLGEARARQLVAGSPRPVILLGGIDPDNVAQARRTGAFGVAAMSSICSAPDMRAAASALAAVVAAHA